MNLKMKVIDSNSIRKVSSFRPYMAIHGGKFHADDVFCAVIAEKLNLVNIVVRTRDASVIGNAKIVADVGMCYDPTTLSFDHHQEDIFLTSNVVPACACELMFTYYQGRLMSTECGVGITTQQEKDIAARKIIKLFIRPISAHDNGVDASREELRFYDQTTLSRRVERLNGMFQGFEKAMKMVTSEYDSLLLHVVMPYVKIFPDVSLWCTAIADKAEDDSIRVLYSPVSFHWDEFVDELQAYNINVVVTPNRKGYSAFAIPAREGSLCPRFKFPSEWRGLEQRELERVSGIRDLQFCHVGGWLLRSSNLKSMKLAMAFHTGRESIDSVLEYERIEEALDEIDEMTRPDDKMPQLTNRIYVDRQTLHEIEQCEAKISSEITDEERRESQDEYSFDDTLVQLSDMMRGERQHPNLAEGDLD
jgi:uncharacterized UPF0160 family protein